MVFVNQSNNQFTQIDNSGYEEFEYRMEKMTELFPHLKFSLNTKDYDRLDEELVQSKNVIVYYSYSCICCCPENFQHEFFEINRNHNITYRDFYEECLIKWKYNPYELGCNHLFLEGFNVNSNNNVITPIFGS